MAKNTPEDIDTAIKNLVKARSNAKKAKALEDAAKDVIKNFFVDEIDAVKPGTNRSLHENDDYILAAQRNQPGSKLDEAKLREELRSRGMSPTQVRDVIDAATVETKPALQLKVTPRG